MGKHGLKSTHSKIRSIQHRFYLRRRVDRVFHCEVYQYQLPPFPITQGSQSREVLLLEYLHFYLCVPRGGHIDPYDRTQGMLGETGDDFGQTGHHRTPVLYRMQQYLIKQCCGFSSSIFVSILANILMTAMIQISDRKV